MSIQFYYNFMKTTVPIKDKEYHTLNYLASYQKQVDYRQYFKLLDQFNSPYGTITSDISK